MDNLNTTTNTTNFDPPAFDLDGYNPFEGLSALFPDADYSFGAFPPDATYTPGSAVDPVLKEDPIIQEHEIRLYLEQSELLWSPFTSPSSSLSPLSALSHSSPDFSTAPALYPGLPLSTSFDALPSPHDAVLFSPPAVVPLIEFSPSMSTTVVGSPMVLRKRKLSFHDEPADDDKSFKRLRTSEEEEGPVEVVFQSAPQPASSSSVATTSRIPMPTPSQAKCQCTFKKGNQKPARHWRTACPYNPNRDPPIPCPHEGCSMEFSGRKDNLQRHLRKFHKRDDL